MTQERRQSTPPSDRDLYRQKKLGDRVHKERRKDELSRLREVQSQKKLWRRVVISCALLNLTFIFLGIWGLLK